MSLRWLTLAGAVASAAAGQIITTPGITASLDLTWQEDPAYAHNGDGILEPREHALILMTLAFTGQNTLVQFSPPLSTYSSGTIVALAASFFDIRSEAPDAAGLYNNGITVPPSSSTGPNNNVAGTSGYGVRAGFRRGGNVANGTPAPDGFVNISAGAAFNEPPPITTNPVVNADRLGWEPTSYAPRTVSFSVQPSANAGTQAVGLYLDLDGGTNLTTAYLPTASITYGSVNIPIAPGPAPLSLLIAAAAFGRRRQKDAS